MTRCPGFIAMCSILLALSAVVPGCLHPHGPRESLRTQNHLLQERVILQQQTIEDLQRENAWLRAELGG